MAKKKEKKKEKIELEMTDKELVACIMTGLLKVTETTLTKKGEKMLTNYLEEMEKKEK